MTYETLLTLFDGWTIEVTRYNGSGAFAIQAGFAGSAINGRGDTLGEAVSSLARAARHRAAASPKWDDLLPRLEGL